MNNERELKAKFDEIYKSRIEPNILPLEAFRSRLARKFYITRAIFL